MDCILRRGAQCFILLATLAYFGSCMGASAVLSTLKTEQTSVDSPEFSVASGTYSSPQSITLSCRTSGATIYYTTDGSIPSVSSFIYSAAVAVTGDGTTRTLRAIGWKSGMKASAVASATYTINYNQVSQPSLTPSGSPPAFFTADQQVTIDCQTAGATIYYTTDGSTPTTSSQVYSGGINVSGPNTTETIKAIAVKSGMKTSTVGSGSFTVTYLYTLTINVSGVSLWGVYSLYSGYVTTSPSGSTPVSHGAGTLVSAAPTGPFAFINWSVTSGTGVTFGSTGTATGTAASDTVTLRGGNATIQANYGLKIETFAGTGVAGYNGDGIPSTSAQLNGPAAVAQFSTGGAPYIADNLNSRIRLAASNMSLIAGNGTFGFSGDGGSSTAAQLGYPWGVAYDNSTSSLYIADTTNSCIRRVLGGVITTVAGIPQNQGNDSDGPATSTRLSYPYRVAASAGNIYIADSGNFMVRKVTSGTMTRVAGTGLAGYNGDNIAALSARLSNSYGGLTVDGYGNIYIADDGNNRIRMVAAAVGTFFGVSTTIGNIYTVAGTGTAGYNGDNIAATAAQLSGPWGISLDGAGNLYIADTGNFRIRMVNPSGVITTVVGNGSGGFSGDGGPAVSAGLCPYDVSVNGVGSTLYMFIADKPNNRVRKVP